MPGADHKALQTTAITPWEIAVHRWGKDGPSMVIDGSWFTGTDRCPSSQNWSQTDLGPWCHLTAHGMTDVDHKTLQSTKTTSWEFGTHRWTIDRTSMIDGHRWVMVRSQGSVKRCSTSPNLSQTDIPLHLEVDGVIWWLFARQMWTSRGQLGVHRWTSMGIDGPSMVHRWLTIH